MMKIRKLIYEEKTELNDFGINDADSLNEIIYGEWLLTRKELRADNKRILKVLNDTYYVCTLALVRPDIRLNIEYALNEIEVPSIVIPLARFYLSRIEKLPKGTRLFRNSTEAVMEDSWTSNLVTLEEITSNHKSSINPDLFAPRVLTEELLSSMSEIEWRNATNCYQKDIIQMLVTALAINKTVWSKMCEAIKAAAQKYDEDFAFEDLLDEAGNIVYEFDINENPTRIKVPKDPYDNYGNEILEPLKRAGVYQFCDELKEKYDELVASGQPLENKTISDKGKPIKQIKIGNNKPKEGLKFNEDILPDVLNTSVARSAFLKCIERGWIRVTDSGYQWIGLRDCRGSTAQLAYLCGKIYGFKFNNQGGNNGVEFPDNELCALFNKKYIYKQLLQVHKAIKPQKWRAIIDELFE